MGGSILNVFKKFLINIPVLISSVLLVLVFLFINPSYYYEGLTYLAGTYVVAIIVGIATFIILRLFKKKMVITDEWVILFMILNIVFSESLFLLDITRPYFQHLYLYRSMYNEASKVTFQGEDKIIAEKILANLPANWKIKKIEKRGGYYWASIFEPSLALGSNKYIGAYSLTSNKLLITSVNEVWENVRKQKGIPDTVEYASETGIQNLTFGLHQIDYHVELVPLNNQLSVVIREGSPPKDK
jgi:hypothetical protein